MDYFLSLFSQFELLKPFFGHFDKVNGQWVPCVCNSSYSFMPIHLKLLSLHVLWAWSEDMHVVWI